MLLTVADLTSAYLWAVNLNGANLSGADLSKANLTDANLKNIEQDGTICPDGTNSDDHGGTCIGFGM